MIYYKVCYYNGDKKLGGHFLEEWKLKFVKNLVDQYFISFNLKIINIRIEVIYNPDSLKSNLKIQSIEVL